jgi:hypothetical protein
MPCGVVQDRQLSSDPAGTDPVEAPASDGEAKVPLPPAENPKAAQPNGGSPVQSQAQAEFNPVQSPIPADGSPDDTLDADITCDTTIDPPSGEAEPVSEDGDRDDSTTQHTRSRRGRRRGQDKISEAIATLMAHLKQGLPVDIPSIAKTIGCTPENLRQSNRFKSIYHVTMNACAKVPRGWKKDGVSDAAD